ncbi:hypothetical protein ACLOJK_008341 [Asimina triloba]
MEGQSREGMVTMNSSMISASPEIVEIEEEMRQASVGRGGGAGKDVYVAVGKDDVDALKWAIKNALAPGSCLFLVHVFPPITSVPTPVGRLSKSQVSREQLQTYVLHENQRRQNLLQKYIRVCTEHQVSVDTMLIESGLTAKAIVDLIPVLNITRLVMGSRRHNSRKGEFVRKNAPDFCEVTIVCNGKKSIAGTGRDLKIDLETRVSLL